MSEDMTIAELREMCALAREFRQELAKFGIFDPKEMVRKLSDDGRATADWHNGYQQGFKYAHTMQHTLDACSKALEKIERFNLQFDAVSKQLRRIEKKIAELDE